MYLGMDFFGFILSRVHWAFLNRLVYVFHQIWELFSHFFQIFFTALYFFSSSGPPMTNIRSFGFIPLVSEVLFIFFPPPIFFSLFRLNNFCWVIFKFTDCFPCHLHSMIESIQWVLYFSYCIFQSYNFSLVLHIVYFFAFLSLASWYAFIITALKLLLANFSIYVISVLAPELSFPMWV